MAEVEGVEEQMVSGNRKSRMPRSRRPMAVLSSSRSMTEESTHRGKESPRYAAVERHSF
jgi:hypothetical protein